MRAVLIFLFLFVFTEARATDLDSAVAEAIKKLESVGPSADHCAVALTTPPPPWSKQMADLDSTCIETQVSVRRATREFPKNLPKIQLTEAEKKDLSANAKKLKALETALNKKYFGSLSDRAIGWHGRSSQQRIVWQDPAVQALLSDPSMIRTLLYQFQKKAFLNYGGGNSLASLILFGLGSNTPSYLISASPNWPTAPKISGVNWKSLDDMRVPVKPETPRVLDRESVQRAKLACTNLSLVFSAFEKPNGKIVADNRALSEKIDAMSAKELYDSVYNTIAGLTKEQVSDLVGGEAGKSTELLRMNGQAIEVMSEMKNLLKLNNGDYSKVLGYGLVSHALDGKHLIASIYGIDKGLSKYRKVTTGDAQDSLKALLKNYSEGSLDETASALMRARLKQVYWDLER